MKKLLTISKLQLGAVSALAAALLVAAPAQARQLSAEEALQSVGSASGKHRAPAAGELKLAYTAAKDGLNTIYVFNRASDRGYMLVAADDVVDGLVLGYADRGTFDATNMPENLRGWLDLYTDQIAYAAANGGKILSAPARASYTDIAPLVKTLWDQGEPYNNLAPTDDRGYRCYTGCVATAMAQVMNTYQYPAKGIGENSYYIPSLEKSVSFDFANTTFDWANMLNEYTASATEAQDNAVATLMAAAGVSVDMGYGLNSSGAFSPNVPPALIKYFGYANSVHFSYRKYYSMPVWMDMIYNELQGGYPLYYSGQAADGSGGHAFVLDGYRASDAFVHINWGWSGMSDGYFRITTLDPGMQGAGGAGAGFSDSQGAIFSLRKPYEGSVVYPNLSQDENFGTKSSEYLRGQADFVRFTGKINCTALADINVTLGVRLMPAEGGEPVYIWKGSAQTVKEDGSIGQFEIRYTSFPTSGKYTVTSVFKYNDQVYDMPIAVGQVRSLSLQAEANRLVFTPIVEAPALTATDIVLDGPLYAGKYAKFTAKVTNNGAEYFGKVNLAFTGAGNTTQIYATIAGPTIDLTDGESEEIEFVGSAPTDVLTPDTYVAVVTEDGQFLSEKVKFTLKPAPAGEAKLALISQKCLNTYGGLGTSVLPYIVTGNPVTVQGIFECISGEYFADQLVFWVSYDGGQYWSGNPSDVVSIYEGQKATVNISFTDNSLVDGEKYQGAFMWLTETDNVDYYENLDGKKMQSFYFRINSAAGVEDVVAETETVSVYPNPATDVATVKAGAAITSVEVYSMSGSLVLSTPCNGDETVDLDVTSLNAGIYILRANTNAGSVTTRLIKK